MGRRKRSDINRAANFTKGLGDEDQPTKKPKIASGKENQPLTVCRTEGQLTNRHLNDREMSVSPTKNLRVLAGMKSRFRVERDTGSHISQASTYHSESDMLGHTSSFYEFQISTKDSDDLGSNHFEPGDNEKRLLTLPIFRTQNGSR